MSGVEKKGYISCQGESGSCAFGASRVHYFNYTAAPQPSFEEVVRRVVERDAQLGILPIQNSRSGLIGEPLTVLARSDLFIVAEHYQPIRHHLMVNAAWVESVASPEIRKKLEDYTTLERSGKPLDAAEKAEHDQITRSLLSQITAIYSDEQGLKQCDRGLKIALAGAERRLTSCTAKASRVIAHETDMAKLNKQELPGFAAIASEECATMYKNIRLVSDINDDKANTTRYVAVSREEAKPSQLLADIDVKALLFALSTEDLDALFEIEPLRSRLEALSDEFGFGESSFRAGQVGTARARLLREYLGGDKDALQKLLDHLDFPAQRRIKPKLEPIAQQIRDHVSRSQGKEAESRLKELLKTRRYNDKLRSIFIIRARNAQVKQADIIRALVEKAAKLKNPIEFNVVTELPKPIDDPEEGLGLVVEADGSLLGVKIGKKKETSGGLFSEGYQSGDLERLLHDLDTLPLNGVQTRKGGKPIKLSIKVLGTFAKDPRRFGVSAQADASIRAEPRKDSGWVNRREDRIGGEPAGSFAGGTMAFFLTAIIAGSLAWYAWANHLFGN